MTTTTTTATSQAVTAAEFATAFANALTTTKHPSALGTDATNPANLTNHHCYLTPDRAAGYTINPAGDLQSVFNTSPIKGLGATLITEAIIRGAVTLDCFDGFLPGFYARHGFIETRREANWVPGGPDVIYMTHRNHH